MKKKISALYRWYLIHFFWCLILVTQTSKHKEPPYLKLTARESMASINARRALNTYEEVTDRENMYATVSGNLRNTLRKVYLFIKITKRTTFNKV